MKFCLIAAGIYNLVWGTVVILFPLVPFRWAGMEPPRYPELWQCIGMIVGVYGVGYLAAARDPARHWPIVLVGFLGKIFGPIGFAMALVRGTLPTAAAWTILTNDLIWWAPFVGILWHAFRVNSNTRSGGERRSDEDPIDYFRSESGETLAELSAEMPLLVVFLRHAGCTFHREAVMDLVQQRKDIEAGGVNVAVVHMGDGATTSNKSSRYLLDGVIQFSDPHCVLYDRFELPRGSFRQLFAPRIVLRGLRIAVLGGRGFGLIRSDGFQMPGVVLLSKRNMLKKYVNKDAADRPDYCALAKTDERISRLSTIS